MKHLKTFENYNPLAILEDLDERLQATNQYDKWKNFIQTEFDKHNVENWFDYLNSGGDLENAINHGEELIIKDAYLK